MKKYFKWTVWAALTAGFYEITPAFAGPVLWISDAAGNIGQVDIVGQSVVAGSVHNTGLPLTDIGFNSTGTLFGTTFTNLYSINMATGVASSLGSYGATGGSGMNALVGGGGVNLLASSFTTTQIYSVDPASPGTASVFGPAPLTSAGDLAFGGAALFGSGIDPASGNNELLNMTANSIVDFFHVGSAAGPTLDAVFGLADDGTTMYAVDGTEVYSVDLATAILTPLFDYGAAENGQALGAATGSAFIGEGTTVPEPLTLSLFGTGVAGLAAWRRRKTRKA